MSWRVGLVLHLGKGLEGSRPKGKLAVSKLQIWRSIAAPAVRRIGVWLARQVGLAQDLALR